MEQGGGVETQSNESVSDDVSDVVTVDCRLDGRVVDVVGLHDEVALRVFCEVTWMHGQHQRV